MSNETFTDFLQENRSEGEEQQSIPPTVASLDKSLREGRNRQTNEELLYSVKIGDERSRKVFHTVDSFALSAIS